MTDPKPKKEIRCINCNNIIANGHIKDGLIAIICRTCNTTNTIQAEQKKSVPFGDRQSYNKKSA